MSDTTDRLIVGVDFGTTFTGCSFVYSKTPGDIEIIKTWPGGNGISTDKVPSEFTYLPITSSPTDSHYSSRAIAFGYQLRADEDRVKCVKLLLEDDKQLPSFVSAADIVALLTDAHRTVTDAVADYLTKIKQHALSVLEERYGNVFMASTNVQFILTVPAVWSDAAKDATMNAANNAGMGKNLRLISEPEAAAVYCLKVIQPNHLKLRDNIVVCDAGGGTVDLITYRVAQLEPLGVEETVVGTGGICGSVFLNFGFENLVKSKFGHQAFGAITQKPRIWQLALRHFDEYVKRQYSDDSNVPEFNIPMVGVADNVAAGISEGFMTITNEEVKTIFEAVIGPIIKLVEDQIAEVHSRNELVSAILLVGGLGQSAYLLKRLKNHFKTNHPPAYSAQLPTTSTGNGVSSSRLGAGDAEIKILQPVNAWTAIVRGAALRGLEGTIVTGRRCRSHYGLRVMPVFDPDIHTENQRSWDELMEIYRADDCMEWFVGKGTLVSEERTLSLSFGVSVESEDESTVHEVSISCCKDEDAPTIYGPSVKKLCTLKSDLSRVSARFYKECKNSYGTTYRRLSYAIVMKMDSASMTFTLKAGGQYYGTVSASFDHA